VHQVNNAIARGNAIAPGETKQAAAQTLERIIDQELLVQNALKHKLDRDPQVMQAIEEAKRQILARAYLQRAAAASSAETSDEVSEFYRDNPALFERRRIYRVHELAVAAPGEKLDALKAAAAGAKNIEELAGWLKAQKLAYQVAVSNRSAEQLPTEILAGVSGMREGQIAVIPTSSGVSVVQLLQAQDAALSEQQARPIIERYLQSRKLLATAQAEVRKLREHATIEYFGEFDAARVDDHDESIRKGLAGLR
jgi:EpsD family peptidyl-prolyl cis-trans isomerase